MSLIEKAMQMSRERGMMGGNLRDYMTGLAMNEAERAKYGSNDYDYAIAGGSQGLHQNGRGHYTDIGKRPEHPTFSTESVYSNAQQQGGVWDSVNGVDRFTPSQQMQADPQRMQGLARYWQRAEPNNILNIKGIK
jgi:hypothetical protein